MVRRIGTFLISFGIDPRRALASLRFFPIYMSHIFYFWRLSRSESSAEPFSFRVLPTLSDKYMESGTARGHYFHQDLWVARKIFQTRPTEHIDIGSRVDGFVAHLLTFMPVTVVDIRELDSAVPGLRFWSADLMANDTDLPGSHSVSCLHALEHFGLGRYGDRLDVDGWVLGLKNLAAMVLPGGKLYLSVPVGTVQRIEFNAQRVFEPKTIPNYARELGLVLEECAFVNDEGAFLESIALDEIQCDFGLCCYVFNKATSLGGD